MSRWRHLKNAFGWWFGVIWALVGTSFLIAGVCALLYERGVLAEATPMNATVVERGRDENTKGEDRYWLVYRWQTSDGKERKEVADVSSKFWELHREGDTVPILVLAGGSAQSRIADPDATPWWILGFVFTCVGVVFGGVGWFLAVSAYRDAGRIVQLLREGSAATARVTALTENLRVRINRRHPWYLTYEFTDSRGQDHTGQSANLPLALETRWKPGDPIVVVYDLDDPKQNVPDLYEERGSSVHG